MKQNKSVPIEKRWKDDCSFVIEGPGKTRSDESINRQGYYRCPACGETYGRPFGERKNRPIRRCMKCGKVVTMEILPESVN